MTRKQFSIEKGDFYTQCVKKMVIFVSINARANNVLGLKITLIINKRFLKHPVRVIDSLVNILSNQKIVKVVTFDSLQKIPYVCFCGANASGTS